MFIEETGTGPALLLLHGSPSPVDVLAPVAEAFAATRRVLTPHLPGYGKTPADPAPVSLSSQLRRLEDELLARGVGECAVVGYSLGAYRALQLAASGRVRVTRAVLLAGFLDLPGAARDGSRQVAAGLRAGAIDVAAVLPQLFLSPARLAEGGEPVRQVAGYARATSPENLAAEQDALAVSGDLTTAASGLRMPVVARVGQLDAAMPPVRSEEISRAVPGAKLEVVSGCGHALLVEDRAGTLASIRQALM